MSAWKDRAGLVLWVQQQTATAELQDRGDESCCVYYGINTREGGWRRGGGGVIKGTRLLETCLFLFEEMICCCKSGR